MFVKICGITNEDDALLAVAMGADAVGFVFAPSPRQIAVQQAYDITRRLPPEILTVGVFRDEHPQAGRRARPPLRREGRPAPRQRERRRRRRGGPRGAVGDQGLPGRVAEASPRPAQLATDLILLDAAAPGSGQVFDWTLAGEVPEGVRLILAGGLDPDNVADAVKAVEPWGVDVSTGVERSPGKKDALKVKRFIERARAAAPDAVPRRPTSCPTTGATSDASRRRRPTG